MPQELTQATSISYNGYIYEIGGVDNGTIESTVYYAPLDSNGSVGTWTSTTALPQTLQSPTSVIDNGYIYTMGGYNGTTEQSTVYYAPINSNGSIGSWNTSPISLPQALWVATSSVYNGYVYEMTGLNSSGVNQSAVYYTQLLNGSSLIQQGSLTLNTGTTITGQHLYFVLLFHRYSHYILQMLLILMFVAKQYY